MGKIASDGSEGSEGKEGGNDSILFPNLYNNLEILHEMRREFMGSNSSSDGSEASEAKESSESCKLGEDILPYKDESKIELESEHASGTKKPNFNRVSLLVF